MRHAPTNFASSFLLVLACAMIVLACTETSYEAAGVPQSPGSSALAAQADGANQPRAPGLRCEASADTPLRTDYARPGPHAVGKLDVTFEDRSRPIPATAKRGAMPARKLVTTIYYPTGEVARAGRPAPLAKGGPFPMLMYSHGFSSSRAEATAVGNRAASHGFVVVAPDFPLTNLLSTGGPDPEDGPKQPADIAFLIDRMIALSRDATHVLANSVDAERIGALGVSLGGFTTLVAGFHPKLSDPRIKAVMPIAGLASFFAAGFYHTRELPMLVVSGDIDAFADYDLNARRAFERGAPNAHLVTIRGGSHTAFALQFDPVVTSLMNGLMGAKGAHPSNPDGFGCGAMGQELGKTGPTFVNQLGGPENFITYDDVNESNRACQGDEHTKPALNAADQVELTARSAAAFFDAHLGTTPEKRQGGCRYLLHELPKHPAVAVE